MGDSTMDPSEAQHNQIKDGESSTKSQSKDELSCLKDVTKLVGYQLGGVECKWIASNWSKYSFRLH